MNYIFLDTETCTWPEDPQITKNEDILVQLAYLILTENKEIIIEERLCRNKGRSMHPRAMAVNHITPEMIDDLQDITQYPEYTFLKDFIQNNKCTVIAHNAPFDIDVLRRVNIEIELYCDVIDTLRVTKVINDFQGLIYDQTSLQFMKYFYRLDLERKDFNNKYNIPDNAHDARSDVVDLFFYYRYLRKEIGASVENMVNISLGPNCLKYVPFGTNKGKLFSELTANQLKWYSNDCDDIDVKHSAKVALYGDKPF